MNVVLNMSHPLSERAKVQIAERIGEFEEIVEKVQIDFSASNPFSQVNILTAWMEACHRAGGQGMVYVIPPAMSYMAYLVGATLSGEESRTPMIWLKRDDSSITPEFVFGGIA